MTNIPRAGAFPLGDRAVNRMGYGAMPSSIGHLRENLGAAEIKLPDEALARLDAIGEKDVH